MRIAVLASHEGSVLQAVLDACANERIVAQVCLVISNNSNAGALRRAQDSKIATAHLSATTHPDPAALDQAIAAQLVRTNVDLVLLAGFMKRLGPLTLSRFRGRIINTHPALLPKFGGAGFFGRRVHEAVLASRETVSGATVHWVEGDYDTGPIIAQAAVTVSADETAASLEAKVKVVERDLLIDTLARLANQIRESRTSAGVS
jgi:phosphoribosylglycinamide formyltransferase-1